METYEKIDNEKAKIITTTEKTVSYKELLDQKKVYQRQVDASQNEMNSFLAKIDEIDAKLSELNKIGVGL